ncbi:hypothetical protein, partial [Methylobacterium nigriterrae]|uniref:hypothetical protein n=1 Tax=Methylobacterium nigriterrae TaxID=3127512 RepID=UPI003013F564
IGSQRRREITGSDETPLNVATRHVVEGEARVARQIALVARLRKQGHDTAVAEDLLAGFEATLADMREHLRVLQTEHDAL